MKFSAALVAGSLAFGAMPAVAQVPDTAIPLAGLEQLIIGDDPAMRYARIVDGLDKSGYTIVTVRHTLLNRALIRARNQAHMREVVVSRANGRILRDVVIEEFMATPSPLLPLDQIIENSDGRIRVLLP